MIEGYHIEMQPHPTLHAIQAQFIEVTVTDRAARKVTFTPWFGALAHAIFFRKGFLDYFHSHICAPDAANCGTLAGVSSSRVTGHSSAPGKLTIGVRLPEPRGVAAVPADETRWAHHHRPLHPEHRLMTRSQICRRLLAAVIALAAAVAALIIAILLVRTALG